MPQAAHVRRKQGPLAVLAIFFGLILGSGAAAQKPVDLETPFSRLAQSKPAKAAAIPRLSVRDQQEEADDASDWPLLPPPPKVVTEALALLPAAAPQAGDSRADYGRLPSPYRARAPPAA